jgi:hypothetical protein
VAGDRGVTPDELQRMIQADLDRIARLYHEAVERACEMAMTGGTCGVSLRDGQVRVDPEVPYGQIHIHPGGHVVSIEGNGREGWSMTS